MPPLPAIFGRNARDWERDGRNMKFMRVRRTRGRARLSPVPSFTDYYRETGSRCGITLSPSSSFRLRSVCSVSGKCSTDIWSMRGNTATNRQRLHSPSPLILRAVASSDTMPRDRRREPRSNLSESSLFFRPRVLLRPPRFGISMCD